MARYQHKNLHRTGNKNDHSQLPRLSTIPYRRSVKQPDKETAHSIMCCERRPSKNAHKEDLRNACHGARARSTKTYGEARE